MQKKAIVIIVPLFVLILSIISCNEMSGEYSLGNHLSLWGNDRKEERVIVYCTGDCHGGIYVVPTYKRHYDSSGQHYAEYVEAAKSNKKWVIAKTYQINEKQENYWIISKNFDIDSLDCAKANCDSILQSHVTGPLSLTEFENKKEALNIQLDFK